MVKINSFQIENVKRVKAVTLEPTANGLTILGGNNAQGKTSVLDAICWALGGNKYKPSESWYEGSVLPPYIKIELSNGLIVERTGKNSDLKVTDTAGTKSGQKLLDSFISEFALDLPKFINGTNKEKSRILLDLLGIESELLKLNEAEKTAYYNRRSIGQMQQRKEKYVEEMQYFPDAPSEPVSVSVLILSQQQILAKNGENQQKRTQLNSIINNHKNLENELSLLEDEMKRLQDKILHKKENISYVVSDIETAKKTVQLIDESTTEIENSLANIETINHRVSVNREREKAEDEAKIYSYQYKALTQELKDIDEKKNELLKTAPLPLPELSISDGELVYNNKKWDCMSSIEQLKAAVAITKQLQPDCGFVLMDKLEQFDDIQLQEFSRYLTNENLQVIATRVSTGEECSIIIEDGIGGTAEALEDLGIYTAEPKTDDMEGDF